MAYVQYEQTTGSILILEGIDDGGMERVVYASSGYAGNGAGLNNPEREHEVRVGPIPRGWWRIGKPQNHHELGEFVLPLYPFKVAAPDCHGRSGFYIHGDNRSGNKSASQGCIVTHRGTRECIYEAGCSLLEVVHGPPVGGEFN